MSPQNPPPLNVNSVDLHDYLQAAYVAAGFANATNANSNDIKPSPEFKMIV